MTDHDLDKRLAIIEERVGTWIDSTKSYREQKDKCSQILFNKIDCITEKLSQFPCKERMQIYSSLKWQMGAIWSCIIAFMAKIVWDWGK